MKSFFFRPKNIDDYLVLIIKIGLSLVLFLPLFLIIKGFYFPYIVPRNLIFRLIIDLIFLLNIFLIFKNKAYRPKFNKGYIIFFFFVLSLTISSIFGNSFTTSFWSNFERMDGLVNWYHILMYVFVLMCFVRNKRDWKFLINTSLISAWIVSLIALGQKLQLDFILASSGGSRLASTLGNAAYVGSYMFLHIVLAFYLLISKFKKKGYLIYYGISILFFLYILIHTQTRGAFLGLALFIFLLIIFYLWFERKKKNIYYYIILSSLIIFLGFFLLAFQQKDSSWVNSNGFLRKLTNISLQDTTTQSRLVIWRNSLEGVKEKPILGWGEENFKYVFNEYFPVEIYHDIGSEVWFDRPHNILIQHLIHGGILGLGLYLATFFYLIYILFKKYTKEGKWLYSFFWISFLLSFLFHDLFIFDNLNINVILYLILAYLFKILVVDNTEREYISLKGKDYTYLAIILILIISFFFTFFLNPWNSNRLLIKSLQQASVANSSEEMDLAISNWEKSFNLTALGNQEKVETLPQILQSVLSNKYLDDASKSKFIILTEKYLEELSKKNIKEVRFNMLLSQYYSSLSYIQPEYISKNILLLNDLREIAHDRPDVPLQLTSVYLSNNNIVEAKEIALEVLEKFPWAKSSHWNLFHVYLMEGNLVELENILNNIKEMNNEKLGLDFTDQEYLKINTIISYAEKQEESSIVELLQQF